MDNCHRLPFPLPPLRAEAREHNLNSRTTSVPSLPAKPTSSPLQLSRPLFQTLWPPPRPQTTGRRPKALERSHYKSQEAPRVLNMLVYATPADTRLGPVVSTPRVAGRYLEAVEEGFGPEEEVGRADEAEFAHQGHRDGGGEPVARNARDTPEPVPDVRHLRFLGGQDAHRRPTPRPGPLTTRPALRVAGVAVQKAETGGRGATEFGRARERSEAKLPLPALANDVNQKSRRLKGKHRFLPVGRWSAVWGRGDEGPGQAGWRHDWWEIVVARSNNNTPANGEAERPPPGLRIQVGPLGACLKGKEENKEHSFLFVHSFDKCLFRAY